MSRPPLSFVLIPGAGGSTWVWHLVAAALHRSGHEAIPVALPAADETAGLEAYAAAVVDAMAARKPSRLVVVAQSLGGFTAPLVCERMPASCLIMVNAMIPRPGETPADWWRETGWQEAKRAEDRRLGRDPDAPFDPLYEFFHDMPQTVIDAAWAEGEPRQSEAVFASRCAFREWPAVPTHVIAGRDDRFFPFASPRRVARERLGIEVVDMPGRHLPALSQPAELAARLLALAGGPPDGAQLSRPQPSS